MDTQDTALSTLCRAVELCDNNQALLARRCKRKPQEIWNWINRDKKAPVDACPFIEAACDFNPEVTCEKLRPDYEGWEILRLKAQEQMGDTSHNRRVTDLNLPG